MARVGEFYGADWVETLPVRFRDELHAGRTIIVEGRHFCVCPDCRKVVQLDKTLIGGLHSCERPKEQ